jgi:hypothetical protein
LFLALTIVLTAELKAQSRAGGSSGRLDQIEAQRLDKSRNLGLEQPATTGNTFRQIGHFMRLAPINFEVGGLGPGAGPAINSVLEETTYSGRLLVRTWGHLAVHGFYSAGTGAELRNFSAHDLTLGLEGSHADAPQLEYYGPGPNSSIHNRTNFRREDTLFNFRVGLRTHRNLAHACRLGELLLHAGPGTNDKLATTKSEFGPNEAPGVDVQSNYLIGGCSVQLDSQDFPGDPHKGTYVGATLDRYNAESHSPFSFYRLSVVGEQYVPFFNRKRVIAIRAKTDLSFHSADQVVPFYLQPTLGSDTDLRGFRRYRFYDENSISLNAEYRWEINTGFDMALFVDGGNVFHRPGQFSLSRMESSVGFGLRFKNQSERRMIARLDTGFSREGFQIWLRVPKLF